MGGVVERAVREGGGRGVVSRTDGGGEKRQMGTSESGWGG